ncbi:MAG: hypothetical protein ACRYGR_09280 [Janthinobacterium lividum]
MKTVNVFSITYLSIFFSSCLIAHGSDNEDFLNLSTVNPKSILTMSSESVGESEEDDSFYESEKSGEEKTSQSLPTITFATNIDEERQQLTSSQYIKREKPACHCKKEEKNDDNSKSYFSHLITNVVNTLSPIISRRGQNTSNNSKEELGKENQSELNAGDYQETTITNRRRKSFNRKILTEIEHPTIKERVIRRIEKESKSEEEFLQEMTQEEKENIVKRFEELKKFATQTQVFQLMRTSNIQHDAKEFIYTSIYYLFLLDEPHHPFKMVNEGWLCIRNRFEAAIDGQDQIKEMNLSPLYSHRKSMIAIDREFGEKIIDF